MAEEKDKPAPTAEQEVLEDTEKGAQEDPPITNEEPIKETETNQPDNKKSTETRSAPTKNGKMVVCRVIMLDATTKDIEVDKGADGQVLFEKVCTIVGVSEKEYFGLTYVGARDVKFWLCLDKRISKQLKGDRWVFEFAVKFYPPEPSLLLEDRTKYLLSLQVRIDVFNGRLPCSLVTHAILGAYSVQADIGDFEHPRDGKSELDYLRGFDFAPQQSEELYYKIYELHKTLKGMVPVDAEDKYLENAKKLAMYGVDLHKAKDSQGVNILIGVCSSGVQVYRDKLRVNRFVWPKILKLSYKRSNFYVKLRPQEGDPNDTTVCFKLENHKMAKLVWKTCVEHHTFFRLKESEPPRKGTLFPRFNSRFRYSGRTQKQIQEKANTLGGKEPFERPLIKRRSLPDPYIDRNSDHPLDQKDRLDEKNRDPATLSTSGPPPYSQDADTLNRRAPGESHADKALEPPGDSSEDRLDNEMDKMATLERRPGEDDKADLDAGPGLVPVGRKSKRSKEEKEKEKKEKEEEKRRKREEERKKKLEKKKGKGQPTTEDRTDKLGDDDATLTAEGQGNPDSAELRAGLAVVVPVGEGTPEKDKTTDGENEPSSPTSKDGKDKNKKDKKGDKHKDKHDKKGDKHDKDKQDKKPDDKKDKDKKGRGGLFGSGRKPKRTNSKSKQSDSEPSSPISPGSDVSGIPIHQITQVDGESGQEMAKDMDNNKPNGRKKEVKFIDECDNNTEFLKNRSEHKVAEIASTVTPVVNTMQENESESLQNSQEVHTTETQAKEDKKEVKSEQFIPDENIEDEVFESEAECLEKLKDIEPNVIAGTEEPVVVKSETLEENSTVIINSEEEKSTADINTEEENNTAIVNTEEVKTTEVENTEDQSENCEIVHNSIECKEQEENVSVNKTEEAKDNVDKNTESTVTKEENIVEDKVDNDKLLKDESVIQPSENVVQTGDDIVKEEKSEGTVVVEHIINPDEEVIENEDKGELIQAVIVATEEAGNNLDIEPSNSETKSEEKINEKEKKRREKEEKKKEKERQKLEEKERKQAEKERKKKEKEEKKKLEKEKKENKKSNQPSTVSQKNEQVEETEVKTEVIVVDPVQLELNKALEKRNKQSEEEDVKEIKEETQETKQEDPSEVPPSEPTDAPENTPPESSKPQKSSDSKQDQNNEHAQEKAPEQNQEKLPDSPAQEGSDEKSPDKDKSNDKEEETGAAAVPVKSKKSKKDKKQKPEKKEKPKKEKKKKKDSTGCFAFVKKPKKSESDEEEPAAAQGMPTEPWTQEQEKQEPKPEEAVEEAQVSPKKQRGVGLGWALPAFEEMKERQAAAAAAREAKPSGSEHTRSCSSSSLKSSSSSSEDEEPTNRVPMAPLADLSEGLSVEGGLDNDNFGVWPTDREGSIDRKMQFIAVTPPTTETRYVNGMPEEEGMPFFEPPVGADENKEKPKPKKVPPPVPPKGTRGSSDLDNMSEEDRMRYLGADGLPPTVATESMKYSPDTDETPIATTNFPTVKTETRTVTYEKDGIPVAIEDGILISSQSHSTRTQTIETTTYKTERDGMVETRMEKKVIISDDDNDIDHDQLLADAIRAVTEMDQSLSVEKIECTRQIEN